MTDLTAAAARQMNVVEAIVAEFERQGVLDVLTEFDVIAMAKAVIKAADGNVVQFPTTPTPE